MLIDNQLHTVEAFEQIADEPENSERLLELINGEIVEKVPTEEHGIIVVNISTSIKLYLKQHSGGRVGTEIRHRAVGDKYNARLPDVSVRLGIDNPVVTQGSVMQMPDLAVEIKSPTDTPREMREKAVYYLRNGTQLVWLVYPASRTVEVCTLDSDDNLQVETVGSDSKLNGAAVLPGFELPLSDVFDI